MPSLISSRTMKSAIRRQRKIDQKKNYNLNRELEKLGRAVDRTKNEVNVIKKEIEEILECSICCFAFDIDNRKPILFDCGHSICSECVHTLIFNQTGKRDSGTIKLPCTYCRTKTTFEGPPSDWRKNLRIMDFIRGLSIINYQLASNSQKVSPTPYKGRNKMIKLFKDLRTETKDKLKLLRRKRDAFRNAKKSILTCSKCQTVFDSDNRKACFLDCGHSFCKLCITDKIKKITQDPNEKILYSCGCCAKKSTISSKDIDSRQNFGLMKLYFH